MNPLIFNIQKFSTHDGDGVRTTVFFKGCPLRCKWCHNPEGQSYAKELIFHRHKCVACGACAEKCPNGANTLVPAEQTDAASASPEPYRDPQSSGPDGTAAACRKGSDPQPSGAAGHDGAGTLQSTPLKLVFDRSKCTGCGICTDWCVTEAREIAGKEYTVKELVKEVLKDRIFYEQSGGGVTLSGGEVMAQNIDFVEELCRQLHREGVSIFIDTSGFCPYANFERILPYVDTFLYDIKPIDERSHLAYIGVDNRLILENLKRLSDAGARLYIRIPVVIGADGDRDGMERIRTFLTENHIRTARINLLPYHDIGRGKFAALDRAYEEEAMKVPPKEDMEELKTVFTGGGTSAEGGAPAVPTYDVRIGG